MLKKLFKSKELWLYGKRMSNILRMESTKCTRKAIFSYPSHKFPKIRAFIIFFLAPKDGKRDALLSHLRRRPSPLTAILETHPLTRSTASPRPPSARGSSILCYHGPKGEIVKRGKRKEEGVGGNIDPTSKEWRRRKRGDAGAAIRNYCTRFCSTKKISHIII